MLLAEDLKNAILQYAMQGKLVKQNQNDEPASVLLKKIEQEKEQSIKAGKLQKEKPMSPITEDETIFEIPDTWKWVRLGEIFQHNTGKALNSSDNTGKKYKYITTSNLYWNKFELENLREMYYADSELEKCTIQKGDLLVLEGGEVGRAAIWNYDYNMCIQNHIHKLRPYKNICIKFFYYLFYFYKAIGFIGGKGIGIKGLSSNAIHIIPFPFPPLAEQERIVEKLEEILPLIDKYSENEKKLEELNLNFKKEIGQSIIQSALQGELSKQLETDSNVEDYIKLSKSIKNERKEKKLLNNTKTTQEVIDEGLFDIPDTWRWVRFGDIVDFRMGKTPDKTDIKSYGNDYPWVKIGDIENDGTVTSTSVKISEYGFKNTFSEKISPKGTLIMSFKLTIGKVAILDIDALHNEAIISIFPFVEKDNITRDYLFKVLPYISQSGDFKSAIKGKTLNANSLTNLLVPLPPIEEQKRIVDKLNQIMPLVNNLTVQ